MHKARCRDSLGLCGRGMMSAAAWIGLTPRGCGGLARLSPGVSDRLTRAATARSHRRGEVDAKIKDGRTRLAQVCSAISSTAMTMTTTPTASGDDDDDASPPARR